MKMTTTEAYAIFQEAHAAFEWLKRMNEHMDHALDNRATNMHKMLLDEGLRLNEELLVILEKLEDASIRAGWWNRKVAKSQITDLKGQFLKYKMGLNILSSDSFKMLDK